MTTARPVDEESIATVLRASINARRVTLSWLHEQLKERGNPVSMGTLSYWRSGARSPEGPQSRAALTEIENLLHLEPGTLTDRIAPTKRTGPLRAPRIPFSKPQVEQAAQETFAALGPFRSEHSRSLSTHSVTEVGADGYTISTVTRSVVQATIPSLTALPFLVVIMDPDSPLPTLSAVTGGSMTKFYTHPSGSVHGGLFELDAPLNAPDTAVVEWKVEYPPGSKPPRIAGHALSRSARELLVWTKFHPDARPLWTEQQIETPEKSERRRIPLTGNSVHQVQRAFGPGVLTLTWGYEPQDAEAVTPSHPRDEAGDDD